MSSQDDPERGETARAVAVRSAVLTCAILLAAAALLGVFSLWMMGAAVIAIAVCAGLAPRRRIRALLASDPSTIARHPGVADAVLAHIPDPVILVDQRAIVVEANEAALLLLPGLKLGHPLSFALRSPVVLDGIDEVLAAREPLKVEYSERVPTERTFEVHIGPLRSQSPDLKVRSGVVLFFRDLTSARRLEAMRTDFVANASHELRTPLASLLGFVETLQGPARNDTVARERFLDIMRQQAQRMTRLIDDLLSLSRIEMRLHVHPTTPVDLVAITAHMVEALTALATTRGVSLEADLPAGPLFVLGDRDELLRLLENLITNASKYGEAGGRVDISLARSDGPHGQSQAVLSVRDYGPGIAPEHLPRLTERFYRVDVEQSREKGGTGLGLAIVKHIVNRHRGVLAIDSKPGEGARFLVTLPEVRT
ncbi:ATP-binding protein [Microvirga antarctica]|uniref:ATP-binding protein n=1 Tax=Microvirga antarctica TaxID=2819233 RepID=UPI001FE94FC4|nr:ATP-binding protein [Microvirga antarctica]